MLIPKLINLNYSFAAFLPVIKSSIYIIYHEEQLIILFLYIWPAPIWKLWACDLKWPFESLSASLFWDCSTQFFRTRCAQVLSKVSSPLQRQYFWFSLLNSIPEDRPLSKGRERINLTECLWYFSELGLSSFRRLDGRYRPFYWIFSWRQSLIQPADWLLRSLEPIHFLDCWYHP
jgi:hypothetical protein